MRSPRKVRCRTVASAQPARRAPICTSSGRTSTSRARPPRGGQADSTPPSSTTPRAMASASRVEAVHAAEELGDEGVRRRAVQRLGLADLHDAPGVHHRQPVGDGERLVLVVRDVDGRDAAAGAATRRARRAAIPSAWRRARRAARRAAARAAAPPRRAQAPRAGAGRRTARQGACSRARSAAPDRPARRRRAVRSACVDAAHLRRP